MHPRHHPKDNKHVLRGNVALVPRCLAVVLKEIPRNYYKTLQLHHHNNVNNHHYVNDNVNGVHVNNHLSGVARQHQHDTQPTLNFDNDKSDEHQLRHTGLTLASRPGNADVEELKESSRKSNRHRRRSKLPGVADSKVPKSIFEAFVLENINCAYLGDSIKSLKYRGCIEHAHETFVLLVCSDETHLEVIRSSWSKRMLKSPKGFLILGIGDLNGIEIQTVQQTQFISLPDAICEVVSDLNLNKIPATKDILKQRLLQNFRGMHLPSDKMVEESLQILVYDRKIYQSGETFHATHTDSLSPAATAASDPCPIHSRQSPPHSNNELRPGRSSSLHLPKPKENKELSPAARADITAQQPNIRAVLPRRCESMRANNANPWQPFGSFRHQIKNNNLKTNNIKDEKGKIEKVSFLDKLFGRYKKRATPAKDVEYATFSGQFPPQEWTWYTQMQQQQHQQQQQQQQHQQQTYANNLVPKSQSWHNSAHGVPPVTCDKNHMSESRSVFTDLHTYACIGNHGSSISSGACSNTNRAFCLTRDPAELSQLVNPSASTSNNVSNVSQCGSISKPVVVKRRSFRHKKPSHRNSSPHEGGAWQETHFVNNIQPCRRSMGFYPSFHGNDIHVEYEGKLPAKNSTYALSRDSGVNCIGKVQQPEAWPHKEPVIGRRAMRETGGPQYPSPCRSSQSCKKKLNDKNKTLMHCDQNKIDKKSFGISTNHASCESPVDIVQPPDIAEVSIDARAFHESSAKPSDNTDSQDTGSDLQTIDNEISSAISDTGGKLLTCSEKYPSLGTVIEVQPTGDDDVDQVLEGSPDQPADYSDTCSHSYTPEFETQVMLPECDMLDTDNYICNNNGRSKLNAIRFTPCTCSHCRQFTYDSTCRYGLYESHIIEQAQYSHSCPAHGHVTQSYTPVNHRYCQHYLETDLDRESCHMVPTGIVPTGKPPPCYSPPKYDYVPPDEQKLSFLGDYKVVGVV